MTPSLYRAWTTPVIAVLLPAALVTSAAAHNPDTSYARFQVSRDALETKLTYDVVTLVRIVPDLDADGDHRLTPAELQAKVPAIVDYLRRSIAFELNGKAADFGEAQPVGWPPDVGEAIAEQDYHAAKSLIPFTFRKHLERVPEDVWVEFRFFDQVGERHNVLGVFAQQGRDEEVIFRALEPDYFYDTKLRPAPTPAGSSATAAPSATPPRTPDHAGGRRSSDDSPWSRVGQFFRLGVEHIFLGYDHILFLLALIVVSRFGDLVKIVTSFTVAHTITLILATLEVIQVDRELVEIAIAATIVYTAVENFWIRPGDQAGKRRWMLTFAFGLVHGFGFAGVLRELGLPQVGLVRSLLAFNVGVEAGQLAIVGALYLPIALLHQWRYGQAAQRGLSALIALCGLGWLLDRAFGLGIMPL